MRQSTLVDPLARILVLIGLVFVAVGAVLHLLPSVPLLGKLPGDIRIEFSGFTLYVPITTCFLLSAFLSGFLWLFSRWR
jgi:hypothetical protein